MIIGIAGLNGAGKGEVIRFLSDRSFYTYSLSDVIRDALRERGEPETRERMIETGTALRAEGGPGVLALQTLKQLEPDRNYAIDSVRHPAEVDALRASGRPFYLLWVDADEAIRFERICDRNRSGDPTTIEALRELEGRELGSGDPVAQQLLAVRELADERIANEGSIEDLHEAMQPLFQQLLYFDRPSWDEYFMSIARVAASRSNCVKRKVAAVVTRDRRIVSTGYNGTPRGARNCNEGGCPRCNSFAPAGTRLDEGPRSHGEAHANVPAAYHGVSLMDA
jgi:dCMP deaminase